MIKRALSGFLILSLASAVLVLIAPPSQADPGNGLGLGVCKQFFNNREKHCLRVCGEPPPGCVYFECTKCGCDIICDDGTTADMPPLSWDLGSSFDIVDIQRPTAGQPENSWQRLWLVQPVRWPAPLR
jgi:hypothetical protein